MGANLHGLSKLIYSFYHFIAHIIIISTRTPIPGRLTEICVETWISFIVFSMNVMDNSPNSRSTGLFYVDKFVDIVDKSVINSWISSYNSRTRLIGQSLPRSLFKA